VEVGEVRGGDDDAVGAVEDRVHVVEDGDRQLSRHLVPYRRGAVDDAGDLDPLEALQGAGEQSSPDAAAHDANRCHALWSTFWCVLRRWCRSRFAARNSGDSRVSAERGRSMPMCSTCWIRPGRGAITTTSSDSTSASSRSWVTNTTVRRSCSHSSI